MPVISTLIGTAFHNAAQRHLIIMSPEMPLPDFFSFSSLNADFAQIAYYPLVPFPFSSQPFFQTFSMVDLSMFLFVMVVDMIFHSATCVTAFKWTFEYIATMYQLVSFKTNLVYELFWTNCTRDVGFRLFFMHLSYVFVSIRLQSKGFVTHMTQM